MGSVKTIKSSFFRFVEGCLDLLLNFINAVYAVVKFTGKLLWLANSGLGYVLLDWLVWVFRGEATIVLEWSLNPCWRGSRSILLDSCCILSLCVHWLYWLLSASWKFGSYLCSTIELKTLSWGVMIGMIHLQLTDGTTLLLKGWRWVWWWIWVGTHWSWKFWRMKCSSLLKTSPSIIFL